MSFFKSILVLTITMISWVAQAEEFSMIRWTGAQDQDASIRHVIEVINTKTGKSFTENDFLLQDNRDLAFTKYQLYQQLSAGVPVEGKAIRIWVDLASKKTIQVEAALDLTLVKAPGQESLALFHRFTLSDQKTMKLAHAALKKSGQDLSIRGIDWKDRIVNRVLIRLVTIKGKRGKHQIQISHQTRKVVAYTYEEFPQIDQNNKTMELDALVYPIYEEVEGTGEILTRVPAKLTNVYKNIPEVKGDIYALMKTQKYYDSQYSPVLGATIEGRAQGYWSMAYLKSQAAQIRRGLVYTSNDYSKGVLLQGEFATINIHPDAFKVFKDINFPAVPSAAFYPNWLATQLNGKEVWEMIPGNAFAGKPLMSPEEVITRPARRLPNNDAVQYLNDGFDEIQVYYAINTLMKELHTRGLTDPDLSTRPFNAFLFNPDVEYRDNAYYTDDTINFTTYSDKQPNMARDNSTIWHELGHGLMDRLMGDTVRLADTGGLSEGMADFLAQIIVQAVTKNAPFPGSAQFRIINQTGFFLTNEVHDDGEAYGGAMNDFMMAAIKKDGQLGLHKVTDVILEAMRLCRDHPALTAAEWFNHILFADSLGRTGVRAAGELAPLMMAAINGRNFSLTGSSVADFKLVNMATGKEVVAGEEGSRGHAIPVELYKNETAYFEISVKLESSKDYTFTYPLQVKVEFEKGALQGAVHWIGKENGPKILTLYSEADTLRIPLAVSGTCDYSNRQDGSCVDYAYVQILNQGELQPKAKKRFYVQVKNP
jgi:hypothetical protein